MDYKQIAENNDLIVEFIQNSELIVEITRLPDWNSLMQVVAKIAKFSPCYSYQAVCKRETVKTFASYANLEATYKAIVEFIKWYNKEK